MTIKVVSANELPEFMPLGTSGKSKYPWFSLQPGQGFKFDASISLTSARSQVANKMRGLVHGQQFIVRLDAQQNIWCIRVDGLTLEQRDRWRGKKAPLQVHRPAEITGEMFGEMTVPGPHVVTAYPRGPHVGEPPEEFLVQPEEPDFLPAEDAEWDQRAAGGVDPADKEII